MAIGDDFNIDYIRKMIYHDEVVTDAYVGGAISAAKSYNANTTVYTDETTDINEATANDVALPPIQTTSVGDAIYVGEDTKFCKFRLNVSTAGVHSGITLQWQYYNGSTWVALTVQDPTSFFTVSGTNNITWVVPANWTKNTIDTVEKYWIRCVVTAHNTPSITTAPLAAQGWERTNYTVNQLYSWLMNTFDEQGAMDDEIPMSAQTPSAYSIINNWFIDDLTCKYLREGAVTQTRDNTVIALLGFQISGYTSCVKSDITKAVVWDAAEHGPLLAYDNTTRKWWVRTADSFAPTKAITITTGTGAGTADAFDNTGSDLFANVYTLGTIESLTDIYIYQADAKLTSWWNFNHIDILVKVSEFGTEIDNAVITVLAHVYTDFYDYFEIDLTAGGRNAVPLATADDLDNQTTAGTTLNYMDTVRLMFVNGTIPYTGAAGDAPVKHKVIHGQTSHATAYILNAASPFELGNIEGTFQNAEVIEICEEIPYDARVATKFFAAGDSIDNGGASTAIVRKVVQDAEDVGTEGILFVTDVSGAWSDNDPIEIGVTQYATQNGSMATNTFTATTSATVTFADTVDRDLDNGAGAVPYNVIIDCNSMAVASLYEFVKAYCRRTSTLPAFPTNGVDTVYSYPGEYYKMADTTYTQIKKASPFGTFAGGKFFGARGIWIEDMVGTDAESYSLIDANNTPQSPPTSATIKVVAMIASTDRVFIAESTGTGSVLPKKNQYTTTVQSGDRNYIEVSGSLADDAPASGVVRVVRDYGLSTQVEFVFNYTSLDKSGADDRFIISPNTTEAFDADDRAYNPYIDTLADVSGEAEVILKYSGGTKYIVARVRLKGYIPFEVPGSFGAGLTTVNAIRTTDGIYQP